MSLISEPRNGRGLPVEGKRWLPCEAGTEHCVTNFVRKVGLGRPYFLGSHPYTWGEFDGHEPGVSPIHVGRVC